MMGSESMQTLTDLVFQSKMPLFDGTLSSAGLPKPPNMSDFLGKPTLQYNGAYVTYDPRVKDGARFTPPWSSSKTSLLDGRSPLSHLSGRVGQDHIIYRHDGTSSEEGHSHSASICHTPPKSSFVFYTKNPEISSPLAAVPVGIRKQKSQCENSSSHPENSAYLAVPKPVYRHGHCCSEPGCIMGPTYSGEQGSPRKPNTVYEREWMLSDAHYAEISPIQRKAQDTLLQQRGLQFEPGTDPLKKITVDTFTPSRTRTALIEPNYSSYPCAPTRALFGSLSEHSQPLQTPPRGYPGLFPSHPTYEHMTSEVYQERSPMSKYGQLAQHPAFYYPQANVEVENRMQCKDSSSKKKRDEVLVLHKRTISNPQEHYIVPRSFHAEMPLPLPNTEMLPAPSFLQSFEYPCYAVPRFHLDESQIRSPLKRQHASPVFHSSRINVSSSKQHMASVSSSHKGKSDTSVLIDLLKTSPPFLPLDQASPTRRLSQPGVSPSSIQISRFFSPLTGLHLDPAVLSPPGLSLDQPVDYSSSAARVTCPKLPKGLPASPAERKSLSPNHNSDRIYTDVPENVKVQTIINSPAATAKRHIGSGFTSTVTGQKDRLKRSISQVSSPVKIKGEKDLYEVDLTQKRQKVAHVQSGSETNTPPLPVIDTVFSLAPYQAYLQASRALDPSRVLQRAAHCPAQHAVKPKPDIKEKTPAQDDQQHVASVSSKQIHCETPTKKTVIQVSEPPKIKVEKVDPSELDQSVETDVSQSDSSQVIIKKEPEDHGSSDSESMLPKQTCESDNLGIKPTLLDVKEAADEPKPIVLKTLVNSPCGGNTHPLYREAIHQPVSPTQLPETKLNFRNIPPQCLKLSSYKIVLPDGRLSSPFPLSERPPPTQPMVDLGSKQEIQIPARKHFFELHHSLCKLVSKSVSASSEQDLRDWLSQLEINEPVSPPTKVQKVSCLLGVKAKEKWINEEMKSALQEVLHRLGEYRAQERCPFPHVMRTGAVFLPMLVVKELLFPMVQGCFIDQVLQEHKVGLRPTTLSEEKILIQLHKRACSSKLRRLMSLKHLPDIYADVVNILYYTYVCKHLGLDMGPDHREQDGRCEAPGSWLAAVFSDTDVAAASASESQTFGDTKEEETQPTWIRNKTKSRVKNSSRRMFLDNSLSEEEEEAGDTETIIVGGDQDAFPEEFPGVQESQDTDHIVAKQESSFTAQSPVAENLWTCPLSFNDVCSMERESEDTSSSWFVHQSSDSAQPQVRSRNHSGMVLKLRRMLSGGLNRKKARYQAVLESGMLADPSSSQTDVGEAVVGERKVTHGWQRTGMFSHTLRPLSSSSKRHRRSLLKIKYCPYLSACHSAEHRRRWVLRSAVQRARKAMRLYYPDLVGKTIHHLYEEDDKSEVWYRGEVLRIHEAHTNPLKTIFEVRYDSEPEWKYYLELLMDYKKGWLKIED